MKERGRRSSSGNTKKRQRKIPPKAPSFRNRIEPPAVLVVDDYLPAREMYESFLTSRGYSVRLVSTGIDALTSLAANRYDLVVLDYNLPDMNGVLVLQRIREKFGDIPVVMITANDNENVVRDAVMGGVSEYLLKPVQYRVFLERVEKALQLKTPPKKEPPPLA